METAQEKFQGFWCCTTNNEVHEETRQTTVSKSAQSKSEVGRPGHLAMFCSHQGVFHFALSVSKMFHGK